MLADALKWVGSLVTPLGKVAYVQYADPKRNAQVVVEPSGYRREWYSAALRRHILKVRVSVTINEARDELAAADKGWRLCNLLDHKQNQTFQTRLPQHGTWTETEAGRTFNLEVEVTWNANP